MVPSQSSTGVRACSRRVGPRQRGAALVEFAIAVPVLVLIVFGVVDGARAFATWNEIKNAAREGAVYAQTHPLQWKQDTPAEANCANGDTIAGHADAESDVPITVTISYGNGATLSPNWCRTPSGSNPIPPGTRIRVEVETPFDAVTPFVGNFFSNVRSAVTVTVQG
jgi:Flp pilus assembly protein TadG